VKREVGRKGEGEIGVRLGLKGWWEWKEGRRIG